MRLTELSIRALRPAARQKTHFDDSLKGFGVRVSPRGTKTYVLMHGRDRKLTTIGHVEALGLKEARDKARAVLLKKDDTSMSFGKAREVFLAMHVRQNNRPSTAASTELRLNHFQGLNDRPLASLKTGDFTKITDSLITEEKPSEANHAFVAVKTMLRFAVARGYIERDPLANLRRPTEPKSRDRWLTGQELAKILRYAKNEPYIALLTALVYTGQRLGQIRAFDPTWIERDTVRFPAIIMKSGREHIIPITEKSECILRRLSPYKNLSDAHRLLLKETGLAHFTRHDLRRTYATHMAQLGVAPHVIERLLDHQTGTISGVAAIYNRHHFLPEMRKAVEKWEAHLALLL